MFYKNIVDFFHLFVKVSLGCNGRCYVNDSVTKENKYIGLLSSNRH